MDPTASNPARRTIVVGVDGSAGAARALRWAALEAAATGADLRVVSAWQLPSSILPAAPGAYVEPEEIAAGARRIAERAVHDAERVLGGRSVPMEVLAPPAGPAAGLLAASEGADLLVVGTRGRGGFAGLVLGSVASACVHHSTIPVAVIGGEPVDPGTGPVVVGVEDSDGARRALAWAASEAVRLGAPLRVVHGRSSTGARGGPGATASEDDAAVIEGLRRHHTAAAELAVAAWGVSVPLDVQVAGPTPVEALVDASRTAAVLVLGARGRGGFAGLLLGSVSQKCLHQVARPLVIVPGAPDA